MLQADRAHEHAWLDMRRCLWPDHGSHEADVRAYLMRPPEDSIVWLGWLENRAVGFAEVSFHGAPSLPDNIPYAYLEGWYVEGSFRGRGVGRALIQRSCEWAFQEGANEMRSDCLEGNQAGYDAHLHCGFQPCGILEGHVHFKKWLGSHH